MSDAWPLQIAIAQALLADPTVVGLIGPRGVHSVKPPSTAVLPYIVLGDSEEEYLETLDKSRSRNIELIRGYTADPTKKGALQLYAATFMVLHRKPLVVAGVTKYGRMSLLSSGLDEDRQSGTFASNFRIV
jgi:hypothetical protein